MMTAQPSCQVLHGSRPGTEACIVSFHLFRKHDGLTRDLRNQRQSATFRFVVRDS